MASLPVQGSRKHATGAGTSREVPSSSPEASLKWCLSQLSKPGVVSEDQRKGYTGPDTGGGREMEKRAKAGQWRALVAIRTQHIKGGTAGIALFRTQGGTQPLLNLLKHPECSRKTLDLALSILANCCTERSTRVEVRKLGGISIMVDILKRNVAMETVQNRAARALGNLAMDPESSTLIHSAGGVPLLLLCVSLSSAPSSPSVDSSEAASPKIECAQSAARALLYLSDTPSNRLLLLTQGTLDALAPLIAPEYPLGLRRAALRTLHELTRGCGVECAREVSRSGVLAQLGVMALGEAGKPLEELALKTLANLCSQGCLRPLVGSLGVIQKFTEEVKKDPLKSGVYLKALCLCCKEAVNRAKVKESNGLEVLIGFLGAHLSHPLARLAILACVDFVYDESALEQLQELGLVPLLVARLVELTKGEELSAGKMDVNLTSTMSTSELLSTSCFDSFDFPSLEGSRKEEGGKEQGPGSSSFLSLRSWLVSEGLISPEGDLLDSPGGVEGDWGNLPIPSSSSSPLTPSSDGLSPLKCSSPTQSFSFTTPLAPSKPGRQHLPAPSTSMSPPAQVHMSSPSKNTDPPPSTPQPSSASTPQVLLISSPPSLPSPTKPPLTPVSPVSPSKFTSPPRKRPRVQPAARTSMVLLDTPPTLSRSQAYHHPYHPEPWAPESPILLLLSRFSHATDPSAALINSSIISGLLFYLTHHQDPSGRCFRMLCRLSCNPNCLQALVRTGSVALIRHHLCQGGGEQEIKRGGMKQTDRVKTKVKQLGLALLSNLRVQCESGFGSGVLSHVMLSGSEADKMNCALSLPLMNSNKVLLKKLLLDNGGLLLALEPLSCHEDGEEEDHHTCECRRLLSDCLNSPQQVSTPQLHSLYFSLLIGCLSSLVGGPKAELDKKRPAALSPMKTPSVCEAIKDSPPFLKKPRLENLCRYHDSTFDLLFLLDDGTQILANREAVAGAEGSDEVGSEYFRALLRGGFGEAQGKTGEAIPIRDVSRGMLLPVLHYLHGCRLSKDLKNAMDQECETEIGGRGQCQVLGSLASEGLVICTEGAEEHSVVETQGFRKTPMAEMMIGACRFLVTKLQKEVEDLCVSLLLSCSTKSAGRTASFHTEKHTGKKPTSNINQYDGSEGESADESLASRTSGLELSGSKAQKDTHTVSQAHTVGQSETLHGPGLKSCHQRESKANPATGPGQKGKKATNATSNMETISCVGSVSGPHSVSKTGIRESQSASKRSRKHSKQQSGSNTQQVVDSDSKPTQDSSSEAGPGGWALGALLPQVYCFSQRYSYPGLGRACLSLLLGSQESTLLFSSSADCLRRLAREADCTESLKRDLVSMATMALN